MIESRASWVGVGCLVAGISLAVGACRGHGGGGGGGGMNGSGGHDSASAAGGAASSAGSGGAMAASSGAGMGGAMASSSGAGGGGAGGSGGASGPVGPWSHAGDFATGSWANAVTADAAENVIAVGRFSGTIDFGAGLVTGIGGQDVDTFVTKFNRRGKPLWTRAFTGMGDQEATRVAADAAGNVYVAGAFVNTADFGAGPVASAGITDAFLVKLDPAGNTLWAKRYGDAQEQDATGLVTDAAGNVYLTGTTRGDIDFGGGSIPCGCAAGDVVMYLAKIDPLGNEIWAKTFRPANGGSVKSGAIAIDPSSGAIVVAGGQSGKVDFGGGPLSDAGPFVARFLPSGAFDMSKGFTVAPAGGVTVQSIAVDAAGDIGIGGSFVGWVNFGGAQISTVGFQSSDAFVAKLKPDGSHVFSFGYGDIANTSSYIRGVELDSAGNLLFSGRCLGTVDFGNGPMVKPDNFLTTLGPSGSFVDVRTGLLGNRDLALNASGRAIVAGGGSGDTGSGVLDACGFASSAAFVADLGPGAPVRGCAIDADCAQGLSCQGGYCRCSTMMCPPAKVACAASLGPVAVDDNDVYFRNAGGLMKVAIDGGSNPFWLGTGPDGVNNFTLDATDVFWGTDTAVMRMPKAGGAPVAIASNQLKVVWLAVDANNVYWSTLFSNTVMQAPKGGGAAITLATGQSNARIAVDASAVYWVSPSGDAVMKVPIGGGAPVTLASGQQSPSSVAVDAGAVYWTNSGDGTVMKVPLAGGAPVTLATGQQNPSGVAVDASAVYWANFAGDTVMKVPLAGGAAVTIASGQGSPRSVVVDAMYAYWVDSTSNIVMRALK